jgi:two-component system nitrogen regulation response regulator GlnG
LVQVAGDILTPSCLPETLRNGSSVPRLPAEPTNGSFDLTHFLGELLRAGELDIYKKVCLEVDRLVMDTVLRHARGNQVQASELLGISRTTLRAKLRGLGMAVEKQILLDAGQGG